MSQDLGRDVPDLEKLYARKLWADFSYATCSKHADSLGKRPHDLMHDTANMVKFADGRLSPSA